jgi:hypothetical protein
MTSHASLQFEEAARRWDEAGRPVPENPDPLAAMKLYCWVGSAGAKHDGVSPRLQAYLETLRGALSARNRDWYDVLLAQRDYCDRCGETYRYENVSFCTRCSTTFAPCHRPSAVELPNGNLECPDCHRGEIVG